MKITRSTVVLLGCAWLWLSAGVATAQSGPQLPKRWGLGVSYYDQTQPYTLESLQLALPGISPSVANGLDVQNKTKTVHATFDYWLLPFLDVQVLVGNIESNTNVKLSKLNIGIPLSDLQVNAKGTVYGGGFTLAFGGERTFTTVTGQYEATSLDQSGASVHAWVVTPKIGMMLGQWAAVYVGAMYEKPQEKHVGTYELPPFGTVAYSVNLTSADKWGYLAGFNVGLTKNISLTVEKGFSRRTSTLAHLDYRW